MHRHPSGLCIEEVELEPGLVLVAMTYNGRVLKVAIQEEED